MRSRALSTTTARRVRPPSRIIVHRSLHDEFIEKYSKAVRELKVGSGMNPENYIGPLVSKAQQQKVLDYIELGKQEGAKIVAQAPLPTDERPEKRLFCAADTV